MKNSCYVVIRYLALKEWSDTLAVRKEDLISSGTVKCSSVFYEVGHFLCCSLQGTDRRYLGIPWLAQLVFNLSYLGYYVEGFLLEFQGFYGTWLITLLRIVDIFEGGFVIGLQVWLFGQDWLANQGGILA